MATGVRSQAMVVALALLLAGCNAAGSSADRPGSAPSNPAAGLAAGSRGAPEPAAPLRVAAAPSGSGQLPTWQEQLALPASAPFVAPGCQMIRGDYNEYGGFRLGFRCQGDQLPIFRLLDDEGILQAGGTTRPGLGSNEWSTVSAVVWFGTIPATTRHVAAYWDSGRWLAACWLTTRWAMAGGDMQIDCGAGSPAIARSPDAPTPGELGLMPGVNSSR